MSTTSEKLMASFNADRESLDDSVLEFSQVPFEDSTEIEEDFAAGQIALDTEKVPRVSSSSAMSQPPSKGTPKVQKRVRDDSDSNNEFSDSDCEALPSPPKRQRTLRGPPVKRVRFHPDIHDNSLWADLNDYKYSGEQAQTPLRDQTVVPNPGEESGVASPSSVSVAEFAVRANADTSSPITSPLKSSGPHLLVRTPIPGSSSSTPLTKAALAAAGFTSDTESGSDAPDTDQTWSICAEYDGAIRHDCDDVSVPRSSPPPSARGISTSVDPHLGGDSDQSPRTNADVKETTSAQSELPPIFMRPQSNPATRSNAEIRFGTPLTGEISDMIMSAFLAPQPILTSAEITRQTQVLSAVLSRLPTDEARVTREAVEKLIHWQGHKGYEAGYRAGRKFIRRSDTRS